MGILVELASCQFHAYSRAGRMPTLLLFSGMGIRGGTGILPVSCLFSGGQDAHSTPIQWNGHQGWNWHLASFMLILGRAGCPLYSYSVEWASGVELASCQFHAYFRAGRMPTLLLFSG
ncbi:MAG: hypothetical protein F6K50_09370, partial [Moorea sp. SIO3I7]|nr:hypothetical protein [Moorena sp. SIO3I7]